VWQATRGRLHDHFRVYLEEGQSAVELNPLLLSVKVQLELVIFGIYNVEASQLGDLLTGGVKVILFGPDRFGQLKGWQVVEVEHGGAIVK
jgi:hypothetical protein